MMAMPQRTMSLQRMRWLFMEVFLLLIQLAVIRPLTRPSGGMLRQVGMLLVV
jgi:hypothetical protein